MHYKFTSMRPTTEFGKWLHAKMLKYNMDCGDVAKIIHTTKQSVAFHINGRVNPNFPFVVAYCWIFGDDPETIWKLVETEEGS